MSHQAVWFSGDKDNKDAVKQDLALARNAFDRMTIILKSKVKESHPTTDYEKAAWPFYRADADGYQRALTEVLKLIKET